MSSGPSASPPADGIDDEIASAQRERDHVVRVAGQAGRQALVAQLALDVASLTSEPRATISRQPRRSRNDPSLNAIRVGSAPIGGGRSAAKPHTSRIVESPPAPGGNDSPASTVPELERLVVAVKSQVGGQVGAGGEPARLGLLVGD